jgi:hypothetical protein
MKAMGLRTTGRNGAFQGYGTVDGEPVWDVWLTECGDLGIEEYVLPGKAEELLIGSPAVATAIKEQMKRRKQGPAAAGAAATG